eukprot:TRINITY_DN88994_c0_g1_i1.p1 TRINITY_DN88994_c0_g1~~TRINITY_DN88994_c0_g1_i1.p1  ORF type:complete len:598 (-),score=108.91 TRINITY_DN88994_c0_g1_i1:58-1779(-)
MQPETGTGMELQSLTVEDLRSELKQFAEHAVRQELLSMKDSLVRELQGFSGEPLAPTSRYSRVPVPCRSNVSLEAKCDFEAQARPVVQLLAQAAHRAANNGGGRDPYSAVADLDDMLRARTGRSRPLVLDEGSEGLYPLPRVSGFRLWCQNLTESHAFEVASGSFVMLNAAWIGFATDWAARNWTTDVPMQFHFVDFGFCFGALMELILRLIAAGSSFCCNSNYRWNLFDFIVVTTQVLDVCLTYFHIGKGGSSEKNAISAIRILKLARVLRIARIASAFPELHVLISSIMDSLNSLFWTMFLIFVFIYAVGIIITQLVAEHKVAVGHEEMEHQEQLLEYYGTLDQAMVSLYMIISEGIHWSELMEPLAKHISPSIKYLFVVFVGFQLFAMMNIITACFVDNAMKIAVEAERKEVVDSIWTMIEGGTVIDGERVLTREDFVEHYETESIQRFLGLIHAKNAADASEVFSYLDKNGDGSLNINEFLACCDELIGPSKGMALASLGKELKKNMKAMGAMIEEVQSISCKQMQTQQAQLQELASNLRFEIRAASSLKAPPIPTNQIAGCANNKGSE